VGTSKWVLVYVASLVTLFAIDFAWLSLAVPRIYQPELKGLLSEKPNLPVAAAFYLLYVVGALLLAVVPGFDKGSVTETLWRGALLGLCAYGTYDITNLATLDGWSAKVSAIDMVWGTSLTAVTSAVGYYVATWLSGR